MVEKTVVTVFPPIVLLYHEYEYRGDGTIDLWREDNLCPRDIGLPSIYSLDEHIVLSSGLLQTSSTTSMLIFTRHPLEQQNNVTYLTDQLKLSTSTT